MYVHYRKQKEGQRKHQDRRLCASIQWKRKTGKSDIRSWPKNLWITVDIAYSNGRILHVTFEFQKTTAIHIINCRYVFMPPISTRHRQKELNSTTTSSAYSTQYLNMMKLSYSAISTHGWATRFSPELKTGSTKKSLTVKMKSKWYTFVHKTNYE